MELLFPLVYSSFDSGDIVQNQEKNSMIFQMCMCLDSIATSLAVPKN